MAARMRAVGISVPCVLSSADSKSRDQFLRDRRAEWEPSRRQVTEDERRRYLAVL